jgi:hypothetical protein
MSTEIIETEIVTDLPASAEIAAINSFHRQANAAADAARAKAQEASHFAVLAGIRLQTLKSSLPHGEWGRLFTGRKNINAGANSAQIGECAEFEFSQDTAARYIELSRRLSVEQNLSGKAIKRLAAIAAEPEPAEESRAWLTKLTEGRNLRQLYLDLDIITAPDKAPKDPASAPASQPARRSARDMHAEEARELINRALRDIARVLHAGHHQYLPKADVRHLDQQFIACREMLAPYLK